MINVLFNVDDNYKRQCKAVIRSILAHTKSKITFYIVGAKKGDFEPFNVVYLDKPDTSMISARKEFGHITECACYRLFAPLILKDIDKVIYLDCDTLVLDDIKKLWDFEPEYIAGVQDPMWRYQANKNNLKHLYINSGVMVMNLKNLRKLDYLSMIINTQNGLNNLSLLDQDIINIAFSDKIEHLPLEWNVYARIFSETTCDMIKVRDNPSIIHWCGGQKPWNSETWQADKWRKYDS